MAIGSRLRLLSERLTQDATRVYDAYGLDIEPRWFPVLYLLMRHGRQSVMALSAQSGQSQVSVSQVVKAMAEAGVVALSKCEQDGRKTLVALTAKGEALRACLDDQIADVSQAMQAVLADSQHNLWLALQDFEAAIAEAGLLERALAARSKREAMQVTVSEFTPDDRAAFRTLNAEWIETYFELEEADLKALDHPEAIVATGGVILMARLNGEAVGCCALVAMADGGFELAKMAVTPKVQGRRIGLILGEAAVREAERRGATRLYLESNTRLTPAIRLYEKLGFRRVVSGASPYKRCDIQMELRLGEKA